MIKQLLYLEMAIFLSNYLLSSQGDRPAMAHSLEIRLPFLDYRVIEFASRLPANWKINGLNEKEHDGRPLTVNEAKPRENRGGGGRGGYGGGGRGRRY